MSSPWHLPCAVSLGPDGGPRGDTEDPVKGFSALRVGLSLERKGRAGGRGEGRRQGRGAEGRQGEGRELSAAHWALLA